MPLPPYEHNVEQILPVFVYGTLKSGFVNHNNIVHFIKKIVAAKCHAFEMYENSNTDKFPVVICGSYNNFISGQLLYLKGSTYQEAIREIDRINYNVPGFSRIVVFVEKSNGEITHAWMYLWNCNVEGLPLIENGDWKGIDFEDD